MVVTDGSQVLQADRPELEAQSWRPGVDEDSTGARTQKVQLTKSWQVLGADGIAISKIW